MFAKEPLNVLALCCACHKEVSWSEHNSGSARIGFYASLPEKIRLRHVGFLADKVSDSLIAAFKNGGARYWMDRAVRELTS
jgi:hypothetical protein